MLIVYSRGGENKWPIEATFRAAQNATMFKIHFFIALPSAVV